MACGEKNDPQILIINVTTDICSAFLSHTIVLRAVKADHSYSIMQHGVPLLPPNKTSLDLVLVKNVQNMISSFWPWPHVVFATQQWVRKIFWRCERLSDFFQVAKTWRFLVGHWIHRLTSWGRRDPHPEKSQNGDFLDVKFQWMLNIYIQTCVFM